MTGLASVSTKMPVSAPAAQLSSDAGVEQYIIFSIDGQEYGINIMAVREIRGWTAENRLPGLPAYIRGVINLRGVVIPIIDLRVRFGAMPTEAGKSHVVIIARSDEGTSGILVDAISEILTVATGDIKPAPDLGGAGAQQVSGLFTAPDRIIGLLSEADLRTLVHAGHASGEA
jgi:purine-binding chemotaxis protein CheW